MRPIVVVDMNYVVVNGVRIERTDSISPSEWEDFWSKVDGGHRRALERTNGDRHW